MPIELDADEQSPQEELHLHHRVTGPVLCGCAGAARTGIISSKFFNEVFASANDAQPSFDARFRWESFTAFAGDFESKDHRCRGMA